MSCQEKRKCENAIEYVTAHISNEFPQYHQLSEKFRSHCIEEAFEDVEVLIDDFGDGFDESIILETIADDIDIAETDKEPLCEAILNLLLSFVSLPTSFNLVKLNGAHHINDVNSMKNVVSSQAHLLVPNDTDISIYQILVIGQNNHIPLLTYLMDTYHRWRLDVLSKSVRAARHGHRLRNFTLNKFFERYTKINHNKQDLLILYEQAMNACIHRHSLFYSLPLVTTKMVDSLQIFTIYYISVLQSVNQLIKDSKIMFPSQIDIWIIPEKTKNIGFEIKEEEHFKSKTLLSDGLKHTDNIQTVDINPQTNEVNIDKLSRLFQNVISDVFNHQAHKRMVMIIDRRKIDDGGKDVLHAYLPPNSSNIPKENYLYEAMINLTKTEILPSNTGQINDNTINANSDIANMFVLSLHIHKKNQVGMYWHFDGSCTRFFVQDMITLWPSYFIQPQDEFNDNYIEKYIYNDALYDELIDPTFTKFFEINTSLQQTSINLVQLNVQSPGILSPDTTGKETEDIYGSMQWFPYFVHIVNNKFGKKIGQIIINYLHCNASNRMIMNHE